MASSLDLPLCVCECQLVMFWELLSEQTQLWLCRMRDVSLTSTKMSTVVQANSPNFPTNYTLKSLEMSTQHTASLIPPADMVFGVAILTPKHYQDLSVITRRNVWLDVNISSDTIKVRGRGIEYSWFWNVHQGGLLVGDGTPWNLWSEPAARTEMERTSPNWYSEGWRVKDFTGSLLRNWYHCLNINSIAIDKM